MNIKRLLQLAFLLFLIGGTWVALTRHRSPVYQRAEGQVFGTQYHLTYAAAADLEPYVLQALGRVDSSLSMFNPQSTVSHLNACTADTLDQPLQEVLALSLRVSNDTQGAFDVTVAPLVNAWGFGFDSTRQVSPATLDSLMPLVGYTKLRLETKAGQPPRLRKPFPGTMLDFSAIAKGYGVDLAARALEQHGVENYLVEIGGEVAARGVNPEGKPWRVGIVKPTDHAGEQTPQQLQTTVEVHDRALATSGNYRRFYVKDGRRYAHTIDPRTGRPVQHSLLSATVLGPDCATADAYATALMVLGAQRAEALLARHPELEAYLIVARPDGGLQVKHIVGGKRP